MKMEGREAVFELVRKRLTTCATLTAMVASRAISVSQRRPATTCPAIRLRVVGASGRRDKSVLLGDVYLNIYSTDLQPNNQLASIYRVVEGRLSADKASMSTTNAALGDFYEEFCEYPNWDEEGTNRYFLASRWHFAGQNTS